MIGVCMALILAPYAEGRSNARSHRHRLRIVRRTLLVVGFFVCLASLGRALSLRFDAAVVAFVPFTPSCRVLGAWVTSTPILAARSGCSAAWQ
jgi:hypothetical protein